MQKEKITRTKEQEERIIHFLNDYGFDNVSQFADAVGMARQNVWARIKGKTDPDIRMLFKWSLVLNCTIEELLMLFYPAEWDRYIQEVCVS